MDGRRRTLDIPLDAYVVVLTGAGISAESGISTFRDAGGLWEQHRIEEVATPQGFHADPLLVWRFYSERRIQALACEPNAAHRALVELERALKPRGRFTLVTQNVDDLHRRAGSERLLRVHGSLFRTRCADPACPRSAGWDDDGVYLDAVPTCGLCGGPLRPDVVWFGEYLDPRVELEARTAVSECDVFLAIGTSGAVYPAAGYVQIAAQVGARTVLVNRDPPENIRFFDEFHQGKAAEILPGLLGF